MRSCRPEALPDVPVGGVEDPHAGERATGPRTGRSPRPWPPPPSPRRPRREREGDDERHRDRGLATRPSCRASAAAREPGWTGSIQPYSARSASAASSRPLTRIAAFSRTSGATAAGGLLRADQQDAERPAALRDVDQHVLQRARALARRVLVQLVQHDHRQREPLARLAPSRWKVSVQQRADDEPLRQLVQRLDRDDRDARRVAGRSGGSSPARTSVPEPRRRAACSRRMNAETVAGCTAPLHAEVGLGAVLGFQELSSAADQRGQVA